MWIDLRCGEAGAHQRVSRDGGCGAGQQAPERVSAVAGQFHLVGELLEGGLDPVAPFSDDLLEDRRGGSAPGLGGPGGPGRAPAPPPRGPRRAPATPSPPPGPRAPPPAPPV